MNGWLVFTAMGESGADLQLLDLNTSTLQKLDAGIHDPRYPQFSPDGFTIALTAKTGGKFQIFTLALEQ